MSCNPTIINSEILMFAENRMNSLRGGNVIPEVYTNPTMCFLAAEAIKICFPRIQYCGLLAVGFESLSQFCG